MIESRRNATSSGRFEARTSTRVPPLRHECREGTVGSNCQMLGRREDVEVDQVEEVLLPGIALTIGINETVILTGVPAA